MVTLRKSEFTRTASDRVLTTLPIMQKPNTNLSCFMRLRVEQHGRGERENAVYEKSGAWWRRRAEERVGHDDGNAPFSRMEIFWCAVAQVPARLMLGLVWSLHHKQAISLHFDWISVALHRSTEGEL